MSITTLATGFTAFLFTLKAAVLYSCQKTSSFIVEDTMETRAEDHQKSFSTFVNIYHKLGYNSDSIPKSNNLNLTSFSFFIKDLTHPYSFKATVQITKPHTNTVFQELPLFCDKILKEMGLREDGKVKGSRLGSSLSFRMSLKLELSSSVLRTFFLSSRLADPFPSGVVYA